MKLNSIVRLKDGRKGKVIGQLANGEYLLASGKGGQITYFKAEDITEYIIEKEAENKEEFK